MILRVKTGSDRRESWRNRESQSEMQSNSQYGHANAPRGNIQAVIRLTRFRMVYRRLENAGKFASCQSARIITKYGVPIWCDDSHKKAEIASVNQR